MQKMTPKWSVSPDFASFYSQHFLANKGFNWNAWNDKPKSATCSLLNPGEVQRTSTPS
jgi:hypothetical protein